MVRFSTKEVYGRRSFGDYEITVARGKVKGRFGLRSKTEEGIFLIITNRKGESWSLPGMTALDFCKAAITQANKNKEIQEKYARRKPIRKVVLTPEVTIDSVTALDLAKYLVRLLARLRTESIAIRSYVARAAVLNENLEILEKKLRKIAAKQEVQTREVLSEDEIEAIAKKKYSWGRLLPKVATPQALFHDINHIKAVLSKTRQE